MEPLLPDFYNRKRHHILDDVIGCFNDMIQHKFVFDSTLLGTSEFPQIDFDQYACKKLGYQPDFKWDEIKVKFEDAGWTVLRSSEEIQNKIVSKYCFMTREFLTDPNLDELPDLDELTDEEIEEAYAYETDDVFTLEEQELAELLLEDEPIDSTSANYNLKELIDDDSTIVPTTTHYTERKRQNYIYTGTSVLNNAVRKKIELVHVPECNSVNRKLFDDMSDEDYTDVKINFAHSNFGNLIHHDDTGVFLIRSYNQHTCESLSRLSYEEIINVKIGHSKKVFERPKFEIHTITEPKTYGLIKSEIPSTFGKGFFDYLKNINNYYRLEINRGVEASPKGTMAEHNFNGVFVREKQLVKGKKKKKIILYKDIENVYLDNKCLFSRQPEIRKDFFIDYVIGGGSLEDFYIEGNQTRHGRVYEVGDSGVWITVRGGRAMIRYDHIKKISKNGEIVYNASGICQANLTANYHSPKKEPPVLLDSKFFYDLKWDSFDNLVVTGCPARKPDQLVTSTMTDYYPNGVQVTGNHFIFYKDIKSVQNNGQYLYGNPKKIDNYASQPLDILFFDQFNKKEYSTLMVSIRNDLKYFIQFHGNEGITTTDDKHFKYEDIIQVKSTKGIIYYEGDESEPKQSTTDKPDADKPATIDRNFFDDWSTADYSHILVYTDLDSFIRGEKPRLYKHTDDSVYVTGKGCVFYDEIALVILNNKCLFGKTFISGTVNYESFKKLVSKNPCHGIKVIGMADRIDRVLEGFAYCGDIPLDGVHIWLQQETNFIKFENIHKITMNNVTLYERDIEDTGDSDDNTRATTRQTEDAAGTTAKDKDTSDAENDTKEDSTAQRKNVDRPISLIGFRKSLETEDNNRLVEFFDMNNEDSYRDVDKLVCCFISLGIKYSIQRAEPENEMDTDCDDFVVIVHNSRYYFDSEGKFLSV